MIDWGYAVGWFGLCFGVLVPIPQLYRMIRTGKSNDVSLLTYVFLFLALTGYLLHAIHISAPVFIVAQSFNLTTNSIILFILIRRKIVYG